MSLRIFHALRKGCSRRLKKVEGEERWQKNMLGKFVIIIKEIIIYSNRDEITVRHLVGWTGYKNKYYEMYEIRLRIHTYMYIFTLYDSGEFMNKTEEPPPDDTPRNVLAARMQSSMLGTVIAKDKRSTISVSAGMCVCR